MSTIADRTLPIPPGFPVEWERPEDAGRFWERELMHVPRQAPVLDFELMRRWIEGGFNAAFRALGLPLRNDMRRFNTYVYQSIVPTLEDPEELEERVRAAQENVAAAVGRQLERWEGELLPELLAMHAAWDDTDLAALADAGLVAHLERSLAQSARAWEIHFHAVLPVLLSMSLFQDAYAGLLGGDELEPYALLQGYDNHSLEADAALHALARAAAASPAILAALDRLGSEAAFGHLASTEEGTAFLAQLRDYLERYGRRQDGYLSVSEPSWLERPGAALALIRDYAARPAHDPAEALAVLAEERERASAEARARLEGYPEAAVAEFELLLDGARQGTIMQENHNFWIDQMVVFQVRRVVLEAGRRLAAAGATGNRDDVFHLTLEELLASLRGSAPAGLTERIAARKAELERFAAVEAPPALGTLPAGPPPEDPIARAVIRMFGDRPAEAPDASVVTGMAGSPGIVQGRVRIVRSLAESHLLQPGEVLVAPTTSPPWTGLFASAAAVVTDVGGILSHCAVVAREYMIPAVVGARLATAVLRDGQLVEVDGYAGAVRILEG